MPMPGVRHLLRAPDRSGSKPSRVDRAANEMLRAALDSAGRTWRSRRPSPAHDLAEAHARAEAVMKAERGIVRLKAEGKEPPDSLYDEAFTELGA